MDSSSQKERIYRDNKNDEFEEDDFVKLKKVQEYLSPQLSQNKDIINQCIIENTQKKQLKQPSNAYNQLSSRSDLQQTRASSKYFNRESEYNNSHQLDDNSNPLFENNKRNNNRSHNQVYDNKDRLKDEQEAKSLTIDALTTCIYSSITKSKIQEMKIQELENIIEHLQQVNMQSQHFSHSVPLDTSTQNQVYQSNYYPQQFSNSHSSNMRKSPCRKHSNSQSKSPDLYQSFNRQNMNKSPMQGNNDTFPQKNSYWSKSSECIKDSDNMQNYNGNNYFKQQNNQHQQSQSNGKIYFIPTSNSAIGIRNEQMITSSPTKSKSQVQFQNTDSLNNGNSIIQMEYLSKVKFLEEAIDYKNQEIERLMVLTAASRRNNPASTANSKSPERVRLDINTIEMNNFSQDEEMRSNNLKMHMIIQDLERKNADLENELFNCKCEIEEKDRDILKIRQQIDELQNCADHQISLKQINEDLELRLMEKDIAEQNMLVQLEQQKLILDNIEIDQIKKQEDYKDIIARIQHQNILDLQSMQSEKDDMQQYINNLQDEIATIEHRNSQNDDDKVKKALKQKNHENEQNIADNLELQRQQKEKEQEIINLQEEVNLQSQLINQQKQDIDNLKQEINDIQEEDSNKISQLIKQNMNYAQGEVQLQEQIAQLIAREEQMISSHQILAEKQNTLLDVAKQKEDLMRQKEALSMDYKRLNDEREAFQNEQISFQAARSIFEQDRDQLDQDRRQINENHDFLKNELQQLEINRSKLESDIDLFERDSQQFENERKKIERDNLQFQRDCEQLENDQQLLERDKQVFQRDLQQFQQDLKQLQRNNLQREKESQQFEKDCLEFQRDKNDFEKYKKEFEKDKQKFKKDKNEAINQQNEDIVGLQQIIQEKDELIAHMKQQQQDSKQAHEKLKQQIQAQIKQYKDIMDQNQQQNQDLIKENEQLMAENQQFVLERDAFIQERNEVAREDSEILELKKQLMHEGIAKQELQQRINEIIKKKEVNEDLMKENYDLRNTLEQLKGKIRGMQNIDEDIKDYINSMCKEKNNLQDRHVAHLEEIKNLKLQMKAISLENKSLNLSLANLKEEINLYQNQQTDMMLDEKNKKSFLRVHLQKKLNLFNAQLEAYIRSTLDLDEIYYILLFNKQNNSPFSSPQKLSVIQQHSQNQQGGSNQKQSLNRSLNDQSLNVSTPSSQNINFQKGQTIEIDEKTKQKIEQLNNKRKRDLDKVYQVMEDFISLVSQIQQ